MKRCLFILISFFHIVGVSQAQKYWTLQECVEYALAHNLQLKNKQIDIEVKEGDLESAKMERLPAVNAFANTYSVFGHSQDVFGTIRRNDNLNSHMGITADMMIYQFNIQRNQIKRNVMKVEAQLLERTILEREITVKIIQAYLQVLLNKALVGTRDSSVYFAQQVYERAIRTTEAGTTAKTIVYESKAQLAKEYQLLEQAKIEVERAKLELTQLMQVDDYRDFDVVLNQNVLLLDVTSLGNIDEFLDKVYAVQPTLKRYAVLNDSFAIEENIVRAKLYPEIRASATLGSTYFNPLNVAGTPHFFRQGRDNFAQQLGVTVFIPIFNKGRTRMQIKQINLQRQQNANLTLLEKQLIRQHVEKIYFDYQSNYQTYKSAQQVLEHTHIALEYTQRSYEAGRSSIYDVYMSRNNYVQAQSDVIQAQHNSIFSLKMLQYQLTENYTDELIIN